MLVGISRVGAGWVVWVWGHVDVVFVWAWDCVVMMVCVDLWNRGGGGACSQPPSGIWWGWAQAQFGQRESTEDPELRASCASLLPPCPNLPLELQAHSTDQKFSSSPAGAAWEEPGSPAKPLVEKRPCTMRQGLSIVKHVGESIRQPDFKAQIHWSERIEHFLLSFYVLIWKTGVVKDQS